MSKQNISSLVRGAGMSASIWTALDKAVRRRGGTDEDLHRLATNEGEDLIGRIADLIVEVGKRKEPVPTQQVFPVTFQDGQTLEQMIAAGRYDGVESNINSRNFPVKMPEGGKVDLVIVHFNRFIDSEAVIAELGKMDLRSAELPDLLAFGKDHPEEQRKYPIIALGSVWRAPHGRRDVPGLWGDSRGRGLDLRWFEGGWAPHDRFLAARK